MVGKVILISLQQSSKVVASGSRKLYSPTQAVGLFLCLVLGEPRVKEA
jgi:hypothetical protein